MNFFPNLKLDMLICKTQRTSVKKADKQPSIWYVQNEVRYFTKRADTEFSCYFFCHFVSCKFLSCFVLMPSVFVLRGTYVMIFFHFLIKCCTILISTKMFKNNVSQKLLEHIHSCANSFLFQADKGPGVEWIRVVLCRRSQTAQNATFRT